MARQILVPLDDSDQSTAALEHALDVYPDADFVLLHVVNPERWISAGDEEEGDVYYSSELEETVKQAADDMLTETADSVREMGVEVEAVQVLGQPATGILEYIDENDVDGVVMGSRGRTGLDRLLLGSVAERVVRRSPVPVTVVH
ncbi:universal stress protein [Candidatus Halobonum tyrrellensis]|uniref:Universal stress protein n=1 Tax=Candidatus Halobonum tyrrellensis G22 TaxID=1324957 RepID=V4HF95_9EURY|nr:universal stress protein [Candidatus Halobonum tyrrellensis]ESP89345.1 universal stress protein [Candidatus Halobonum tyrrellensis G22]